MRTNAEDQEPTAWLFTRGDESVRMFVEEHAGFVLVVCGPGDAITRDEFPDLSALMAFASVQEQTLQQKGFQLQAVAERRAGDRFTAGGPEGRDRRRR